MSRLLPPPDLEYPESDGLPMADSTVQLDWIIMLITQLRTLVGDAGFVAGNLFWYPVRGQTTTVRAPDALVALGRPPGPRRSYKQWEEDNIVPQVVFEVRSHNNTAGELIDAFDFYDEHGVEEYYLIDPDRQTVTAYRRRRGRLAEVQHLSDSPSPRLGIRFGEVDGKVVVFRPDGRQFVAPDEREQELHLLYVDAQDRAEEAEARAEEAGARAARAAARADRAEARAERAAVRANQEADRADAEKQRADSESLRAEAEKARAEALAAKLRAAGIDPDAE